MIERDLTKIVAAERERKCYGCAEEDLDKMISRNFYGTKTMLAVSILSDAQQVLEFGRAEECRQFINRAKYVMHDLMALERREEARLKAVG